MPSGSFLKASILLQCRKLYGWRAPHRGLCRSAPCWQQPVACAVGAVVVSPALQRGVGETNNSYGVPQGRRSVPSGVIIKKRGPLRICEMAPSSIG